MFGGKRLHTQMKIEKGVNYSMNYSILIIHDVYKLGDYNNVCDKIKVSTFIDNLRDSIIIISHKG